METILHRPQSETLRRPWLTGQATASKLSDLCSRLWLVGARSQPNQSQSFLVYRNSTTNVLNQNNKLDGVQSFWDSFHFDRADRKDFQSLTAIRIFLSDNDHFYGKCIGLWPKFTKNLSDIYDFYRSMTEDRPQSQALYNTYAMQNVCCWKASPYTF